MLRALRRDRQSRFLDRHRRRVLRWAARAARSGRPWTPGMVESITRAEAARHTSCCHAHREFEHRRNLARLEAGPTAEEWDILAGE